MDKNPITFPHLIPHLDTFERTSDVLLKRWVSHPDVRETLRRHRITPEFFGRYFGTKVIKYVLGILRRENEYGNCPIICVMLAFFEKKDIPLDDIFVICVNFKNAFLLNMIEHRILDSDTMEEISWLIDHNFIGVVREYIHLHYLKESAKETCSIVPAVTSQYADGAVMSVSSAASKPTSAFDYLMEVDVDFALMEELSEIEEETLASLDLSEEIGNGTYRNLIVLFHNYLKVLHQLVEFEELTYALAMLIDILEKTSLEEISEENVGAVMIYIKAMINDLSFWRTSVFVHQNAEDIHYLDKTLISSIAQLQIMLSESDSSANQEIEFF
ncbi:MAG: hypothetical protein JXK04_09755 [Campylobacterales bacterium]|nr:hypothetical protein [Campylobacterales bacterium]